MIEQEKLMEWAVGGDADAMCKVAMDCHQKGNDVDAHQWYLKAAEADWSLAMVQVAKNYLVGIGVEKDIEKSFNWCKKAAEAGDIDGLHLLLEIGKQEKKKDALDFLYSILEKSVTNIYMLGLNRAFHLGSHRMNEYTPYLETMMEKRRLLHVVREIIKKEEEK